MVARARQTRSTASGTHDGPERTCVVSREALASEALIRFVLGPDGAVVPDIAGKLPGRGVWVRNDRAAVDEAAQTNAFSRSLKRKVVVSADLGLRVDSLLCRRALDALSIATKAGLVVTGFTKVDAAIARGEAVALIHAMEAAPDGCGKLDRKQKAVLAEMAEATGKEHELRVVTVLGSAELSLAIGRSNVVHAALARGGAVENFLRETERLRRYRSSAPILAASPSS